MKKGSDSSDTSEVSPLTNGGRSSRELRRLSSSEICFGGIKKAFGNFEFDVQKTSEGEPYSDSASMSDESIYHNKTRRIYCPALARITALFILLAASYAVGIWSAHVSSFKAESISCVDPIVALKDSSSIEGMENAVVASDHELCSEVGKSILMDGGNAVDAAVATALCLGVANPASSGLGGGGFILIHSDRANHEARSQSEKFPDFHDARDGSIGLGKDKMTEVIDCRETAPSAATQDMFLSKPVNASSLGGLAVAVPGELRGLELAHARHGKLPWAVVVEPAMKMARDGIPILFHLAGDIKSTAEVNTKKHREFPNLRKFLTKDDNWETYLKEGDLLRNPKLAELLQLVSKVGSDGFYKGDLAESLVRDVAAEGGILTVDDMVNYLPALRSPVVGDANGFTLVGIPPPSSGGATLIGAARFLSGYKGPLASAPDTLSVHRTVEALRHVFAIRMSLSDPAFYTNKTRTAVQDLVSGNYMQELRQATLDNGEF
jgi:gamma-glutamyltranspeptidase